jgi:hypothetical protein
MITKKSNNGEYESTATYSDCENYRYILTRSWDKKLPNILFIGLNPSTATEEKNDPTVTRMIGFSKKWGFGRITVCNLFSFRATDPKDMKNQEDPIGEHNDNLIKEELENADLIVAAWGNHGTFKARGSEVSKYLDKYSYFGLTKAGEPKHVLYLKGDSELLEKE